MTKRRDFLKTISLATGAAFFGKDVLAKDIEKVACQQYTWFTYFRREGKSWMEDPDMSLKEYIKSGLKGYEPSFNNPEEVKALGNHFDAHSIWCRSMYVNSTLHETQMVEKNIENILAIGAEAKKIGIDIIVTNPTPIKWGGLENKSDEQLKTQAIALNLLGKKLKNLGVSLAYHNHDAEMRVGAREFHHMLTSTDPENVKLCLDAHWIYRGSGNSQVALFDIVDIYAERIIELHLRQSHNGTWSEVFGDGDIDYPKLAATLKSKGRQPHIVLEQAIEDGTPHTMGTVEAMSKSLSEVRKVFREFI
jgi:inosose dehydratase